MGALLIELPYPVGINRLYMHTRQGVMLSAESREYRQKVKAIIRARGAPMFQGSLRMEVDLHPADAQVRDIDGGLKNLLDALQGASVYADDSQIVELLVKKKAIRSGGCVMVRIFEMEADHVGGP